jgi:hypothetical protein
MKHFDDAAWLDYIRKALSPGEHRRMQAHLESGCARCAQLHSFWEAVHRTSGRFSEQEPPSAAVRAVKAAFATARVPVAPLRFRLAKLLFDSLMSAPIAGVRSSSSTARHLLYRVESWTIDLRLDTDGGQRITIDGQVLSSTAENAPAAHPEIILLRGEAELVRTSTNDFGEFQLVGDRALDLQIHFDIPGERPIRLKLPD